MEKISLKLGSSLRELQSTNHSIYGLVDDRDYDIWGLLSNQERFMMRAIKGIRKEDMGKLRENLNVATSWFLAVMNRLHIDLDDAVWKRFPYLCSYCGENTCQCKKIKPTERAELTIDNSKRPRTLREQQEMFETIYPHNERNLEHAGIHLAEEQGEVSEAVQIHMSLHKEEGFKEIIDESADYFSCVMGIYNSAGIDFEKEMLNLYSNNCHVCHDAPCSCDYVNVAKFKF